MKFIENSQEVWISLLAQLSFQAVCNAVGKAYMHTYFHFSLHDFSPKKDVPIVSNKILIILS